MVNAMLKSDLLSEENDSPISQMFSFEPELVLLFQNKWVFTQSLADKTKPAVCHV